MKYQPKEEHPIHVHQSPCHIVCYKLQQNSKCAIEIWNEIWPYL